jgi:hypothetical protein
MTYTEKSNRCPLCNFDLIVGTSKETTKKVVICPKCYNDKNEFMNEKGGNKDKIMEKFWKDFDPKGYSIWYLEYQNLESEGKKLFRMNNSKNFFLERIDKDFKDYAFGVHGVYGNEGDYRAFQSYEQRYRR